MTIFDERRDIHPRPQPRPPQPVRVAVACVVVGAALHLINTVVRLAGPVPRAARALHAAAATPIAIGVGIVVTIVVCGLGVFLAQRMHAGRNWARVTLTVLGALQLLGAVGVVALQGTRGLGGAFSMVVEILLGLTSLVFLIAAFQRSAQHWFAARAFA